MGDEAFKIFFDEFWTIYPKKVQKQAAIKAAHKIAVRDRDDVIEATKNYCRSSRVLRGFIKDPPGFLKDGFWKDYLEEPIIDEIRTNGMTPKPQEAGATRYLKRIGVIKDTS